MYNSYSTGSKAGPEDVLAVLSKMGDPQKSYPVIHVAGTNGKGSNCAFMQHILAAAGFKVGAFTGPHLQRPNERISINMQPISDQDFADSMDTVISAANAIGLSADDEHLFFFQTLTCMAYGYFAEQGVDFAIIETGIGGRLDTTNVIDKPYLSVITAPGLDHQAMLGESLEEIASEDAGIIKEGCPVAVYPTPVLPVFTEIANEKKSPLYYIGDDLHITRHKCDLNAYEFSVKTAYFSYQSLSIRLLGEHQVMNAVHALLCVEALRRHHKLEISDEAVRQGLAECRWPGRFEIVSKAGEEPYIVLDGAHNEDGARSFSEAIKLYFPDKHIVLLAGISKSKDYRAILEHMLSVADTVICTCSPFRAMPAEELAGCVKEISNAEVIVEADCQKALKIAVTQAKKNQGVIAAAGSLYLVGELRKQFN